MSATDTREFAMALNYNDVSGEQRIRSVMRIRQKMATDGIWETEILGVALYECDENLETGREALRRIRPLRFMTAGICQTNSPPGFDLQRMRRREWDGSKPDLRLRSAIDQWNRGCPLLRATT